MRLWASWSVKGVPVHSRRSWSRWSLKVPSNSKYSMAVKILHSVWDSLVQEIEVSSVENHQSGWGLWEDAAEKSLFSLKKSWIWGHVIETQRLWGGERGNEANFFPVVHGEMRWWAQSETAWTQERIFSTWGQAGREAGCPGRFCHLWPWRWLRIDWTQHWAIWSDFIEQEVGLEAYWGPLQPELWCVFMICVSVSHLGLPL